MVGILLIYFGGKSVSSQEKDDPTQCILNVKRVESSDFGTWTCKAMYWSEDDWAEDTLSLSTFREASLMFRTYYGEVIAEAGGFSIFTY